MKYLIIQVLLLCSLTVSAQTKLKEYKEYYSSTWAICEKSAASFYIEYEALDGSFVKYEESKKNKSSFTVFPSAWNENVYFKNGDLISKGAFNQGYYDGIWKRYYENGKLKSLAVYANGKEKEFTSYYDNGNVKSKDGKDYYKGGELQSERIELDELKQVKITYYETQEVEEKTYYYDSKNVVDSIFRKSGKLDEVLLYKESIQDIRELFFPNGRVYQRTVYLENQVHETTNYTIDGEIQAERTYQQGKVTAEKIYSDPVDRETGEELRSKKELIFTIVEQMPAFESCGSLEGLERNNCTNLAIQKFIGKHLTYPPYALETDIEGKEFVRFVVDQDGYITNVHSVKGTNSLLTEQAIRLVSVFPKFFPGMQQGKNVKVQYIIPINFRIG